MGKDITDSKPFNELRKRAEALLAKRAEDPQSIGDNDIKKLVHELQVHQIELEMQNEELRRTQFELEESRQKYVELYDLAPIGYLTISPKGSVLDVNLAGVNLLGEERRYLIKKAFSDFVTSEFQDLFYFYRKRIIETRTRQTCELQLVKKDGTPFYALLESIMLQNRDEKVQQIRTTITDITEQKNAEEALRKTHGELERRVEERTLALKTAAEELKYKQKELLRHQSELERVNKELLESNKAISVLARNIDKNRQETKNTIVNMINSNIVPIIKDLRKAKTVDSFHFGLDFLSTHVQLLKNDLIDGSNVMTSLTPTEMRIATMIKNGMTSQGIADKLCISLHTAKTHRRNIRKKLNVQKSNINLTSYLRSIMW